MPTSNPPDHVATGEPPLYEVIEQPVERRIENLPVQDDRRTPSSIPLAGADSGRRRENRVA